jgi:hypothetical protein
MTAPNTRINSSGTYFVNGTFDEVTGPILTNGLVASFDAGRLSSNAFANSGIWTDPVGNYVSTLTNITYSNTGSGSLFYANNGGASAASLYTLASNFWSSTSWTVSAWFNFSAVRASGTGDNAILSHGVTVANAGLHLGERGGTAYFGMYSNDMGGTIGLTTGQWNNVVWQYNSSTFAKTIYVNGRLDTTAVQNAYTNTTYTNTEIGRYWQQTTHFLTGYLGQVAIYNRNLSHSEIVKNYQTFLSRYSNTGTNVQTRLTPGTVYYNQYDEVTYNPNNSVVANNLFGYSQDFISGWGGSNSTNTRVLGRAPDGTTGYMKLVEATTSSNKETNQSSAALSTNTAYTISVYAQGSGRNQFRFGLNSSFFSASTNAYFDLTGTGVVSLIQGGFTSATIYTVGGGWYRCAATFIPNVYTTTGFTSYITLSSGTNTGYFGDGISGINYWGPQLERGSTASIYVATTASAAKLTSFVQRTDNQGTVYVSNYFDETAASVFTWTFTATSVYNGQLTGWTGIQSAYRGGLSDGNYFDGASMWGSALEANPAITAIFPRTYNVTKIYVGAAYPTSPGSWGVGYTNNGTLQSSMDGSTWSTLTNITGVVLGQASAFTVNTTANYIRAIAINPSAYFAVSDFYFDVSQ